jgi:hypothetical protein
MDPPVELSVEAPIETSFDGSIDTYKIYYHDDYRSGPQIRLEKINVDDYDDNEDYHEGIVELASKSTYDVTYLLIHIGDAETQFLRSFPTLELAETYAKCQYYHQVGDFPFIVTGMTTGYQSEGSRPAFNIEWESEITIKKSDDDYDALVIIQKDYLRCHSCNPFAEW